MPSAVLVLRTQVNSLSANGGTNSKTEDAELPLKEEWARRHATLIPVLRRSFEMVILI